MERLMNVMHVFYAWSLVFWLAAFYGLACLLVWLLEKFNK